MIDLEHERIADRHDERRDLMARAFGPYPKPVLVDVLRGYDPPWYDADAQVVLLREVRSE